MVAFTFTFSDEIMNNKLQLGTLQNQGFHTFIRDKAFMDSSPFLLYACSFQLADGLHTATLTPCTSRTLATSPLVLSRVADIIKAVF